MSLLLALQGGLVFTGSGAAVTTLAGSGSGTAVQIFNGNGVPALALVGSGSGVATLIFNASGAPASNLSGSGLGLAVQIFTGGVVGLGAATVTLVGSVVSDAVQTFVADGSSTTTTLAAFGASAPYGVARRARGQIRFVDQPEEREPVRGELAGLTNQTPEVKPDFADPVEEPPPPVIPAPLDISPKDWKKIVAKAPDVAQPVQRGRTRQQMEDEELLVMLMASAA